MGRLIPYLEHPYLEQRYHQGKLIWWSKGYKVIEQEDGTFIWEIKVFCHHCLRILTSIPVVFNDDGGMEPIVHPLNMLNFDYHNYE